MNEVDTRLTEMKDGTWTAEANGKWAAGDTLVDAAWALARKLRVARKQIVVTSDIQHED